MANDVGMIKNVLPPGVQTSPAAPTARPEVEQPAREAAAREAEKAKQAQQTDEKPLEEMVSDLNALVRNMHRELRFSVDEDSGETVIKVIDRETDEVVRQIPSEELMRLRKRLEEAAGVIFQDSA